MPLPFCDDEDDRDEDDRICPSDFEDDDDDYEDDGQPDEHTEWQDLYGGDDWDHGQYDEA